MEQKDEPYFIGEELIQMHSEKFLADKAYDKKIRKYLEDKGFHPLIPFNKRNTKDPEKLAKMKFTEEEERGFPALNKVEHFNS